MLAAVQHAICCTLLILRSGVFLRPWTFCVDDRGCPVQLVLAIVVPPATMRTIGIQAVDASLTLTAVAAANIDLVSGDRPSVPLPCARAHGHIRRHIDILESGRGILLEKRLLQGKHLPDKHPLLDKHRLLDKNLLLDNHLLDRHLLLDKHAY